MFYDLTLLGVFSFCLLPLAIDGEFDWCNHKCYVVKEHDWLEHTMCLYLESGPPQCRGGRRELSEDEKKYIVKYHNEFRQKVARGEETKSRTGEIQPTAANMFEVSWDNEVAHIAQRWADQCQYGDGSQKAHDDCRKGTDDVDLGQNYSWMTDSLSQEPDSNTKLRQLMDKWSNEAKNVDPGMISKFQDEPPGSRPEDRWSHYTAMVWWSVTHIGCGMMRLDDEYNYNIRLVCNYKSRGNYIDKQVYLKGSPASECPTGSFKSSDYPALCKAESGNLYSSNWGYDDPIEKRITKKVTSPIAITTSSLESGTIRYRIDSTGPPVQLTIEKYTPKHTPTVPTYGLTVSTYGPAESTDRPPTSSVVTIQPRDSLTPYSSPRYSSIYVSLPRSRTKKLQSKQSQSFKSPQHQVGGLSKSNTLPLNNPGSTIPESTSMGQKLSPPIRHSSSIEQTQPEQQRQDQSLFQQQHPEEELSRTTTSPPPVDAVHPQEERPAIHESTSTTQIPSNDVKTRFTLPKAISFALNSHAQRTKSEIVDRRHKFLTEVSSPTIVTKQIL